MARPLKTGLDYFSCDTEFDDEMETFIDTFGNDGGMFFVRLWQRAYRTENGEISYAGVLRRTTLAKRVNVSAERFDDMVKAACELGLLDLEALTSREVLTSNGIKKRIAKVLGDRESSRNRKNSTRAEFSAGKTPELPQQNPRTSTQREKERERESKSTLPHKRPEGWKEFAPGIWSTEAFMTTLSRKFGQTCLDYYLEYLSSKSGYLANRPPVDDGGAYLSTWIMKDKSESRNFYANAKSSRLGGPQRLPEKDLSKHASRRPVDEVLREQHGPQKVGTILKTLEKKGVIKK